MNYIIRRNFIINVGKSDWASRGYTTAATETFTRGVARLDFTRLCYCGSGNIPPRGSLIGTSRGEAIAAAEIFPRGVA